MKVLPQSGRRGRRFGAVRQRRDWLALMLQDRRRARRVEEPAGPEPVTLLTDLQGYWDGDAALDATASMALLDEGAPSYGLTGGPGGGASCALGYDDYCDSTDDAWWNLSGETTRNVWVSHNEDQGLVFISVAVPWEAHGCDRLFIALDAQVGSVAHYEADIRGEGTAYDWEWPYDVYPPAWYMLTLVNTPTEIRYYVNGVLRAGLTKTYPTVRHGDALFQVKMRSPWGVWTGAWANLGLWHRVLADEEITSLYNEGAGRSYGELLL